MVTETIEVSLLPQRRMQQTTTDIVTQVTHSVMTLKMQTGEYENKVVCACLDQIITFHTETL